MLRLLTSAPDRTIARLALGQHERTPQILKDKSGLFTLLHQLAEGALSRIGPQPSDKPVHIALLSRVDHGATQSLETPDR